MIIVLEIKMIHKNKMNYKLLILINILEIDLNILYFINIDIFNI